MNGTSRPGAPAKPAQATPDLSDKQAEYLAEVKAAVGRLASREVQPADARGALASVESHAGIDPDPPTVSRRFSARLSRHAFRRLTGWDLRYLGAQVTVLGHSIVRLGSAIVDRTERLEAQTASLGDDLASLSERLDRLEQHEGLVGPEGLERPEGLVGPEGLERPEGLGRQADGR
jgi:hypothetical protein